MAKPTDKTGWSISEIMLGDEIVEAKINLGAELEKYSGKLNTALLPRKIVREKTIGWLLRDEIVKEHGALTSVEITDICNRFGFEIAEIEDLSISIAWILTDIDPPAEMLAQFVERGERELGALEKDLTVAHKHLKKLIERRKKLKFANSAEYPDLTKIAKSNGRALDRALVAVEAEHKFVMEISAKNVVAYSKFPDARKAPDFRRRAICEMLFQFWLSKGKRLTYTGSDKEGKRGGALIRFVNSFVRCVTRNQQELSGETLKDEIARYKAFLKKHPKRHSLEPFGHLETAIDLESEWAKAVRDGIKEQIANKAKKQNTEKQK